jgi:DNA-binding response OmpR family regulator
MKLLLIEDESELAENIIDYLSKSEIICEWVSTFREAEDKLLSFPYDIILLDIMLPDGNGLEILELLKKKNSETGVLIISAKNALDDRVKGLELGADDYLTKPFHLSELNARLKAIFRRRKFNGNTILSFEEIKIDTDNHEVSIHDQLIELTVKEYELLLFFISNKNRVITKQSIAEYLWGDNVDFLDSYDFVYQHIKNLRKKITNSGGKDYLKTIYGLGYKFVN